MSSHLSEQVESSQHQEMETPRAVRAKSQSQRQSVWS